MERRHSLAAATLDTLPLTVAVLDENGDILLTNRSWESFGGDRTDPDDLGVNYVATAEDADDEYAGRAAAGLRAVLSNERESFSLEYPCHSPDERRWFLMRAKRFEVDGHTRVSVSHLDITDRKLAEIAADETAAELREEREALEHVLERIDAFISPVTDAIVDAQSRAEIERRVCERLVETDPYVLAWIGRVDVTSQRLIPREWSAREGVALENQELVLASDGGHPAVAALEANERRVVPDLVTFDDAGRWWPEGAETFRSVATLPLSYGDVTYGVLTLFADEPEAFDPRELVVLESLARTIATAINAIEARRLLTADTVVEVDVTIEDPGLFLAGLSRRFDSAVTYRGLTHRDDGSLVLFVEVEVDGQSAREAALEYDEVTEASIVTERDDRSILEIVVGGGLVGALSEHGAVIRRLAADQGVVDLAIDLSDGQSARSIYDVLEGRYDLVELVSYRERERPPETPSDLSNRIESQLTDRQLMALRKAYYGGYFEWPRGVSGEELAATMDISRPTFHQHLRAAMRNVFDELFEGDEGRKG